MDRELFKALTNWGDARKVTKDNASLLVTSNFDDNTRKLCVERMKMFGEAEQHLFSFEGRKDLPKPLTKFFAAYHDRGCTVCVMSSAPPAHPECARLIDLYFRSIAELEIYVHDWKIST